MAFLTVFSRLKIRTRIYVGFAVTLLLVVVLGGVGITSLKSTQESFYTFKRESGSAVENSDINTDFANLRRDVYRFGTTSNTQAITAAREAMPHIKDQLAGALRSAGTDTRKAKLETVGRMLDAYAADFDQVVSLRAGRDKAEAELAKAGKDASAAISIIVMTASMNGNQEVTALAGQVQQSFMMARLFSARFSATNDETLADGFKLNFTGFENARTSLAELLTEEEQQRYAADAGKYASIYDRTFDDFAAKSRSLQQLTLSMDTDGAAIQQNLLDIVADLTSGLATLDGEMSAVMEASVTQMIAIAAGALVLGLLIATLIFARHRAAGRGADRRHEGIGRRTFRRRAGGARSQGRGRRDGPGGRGLQAQGGRQGPPGGGRKTRRSGPQAADQQAHRRGARSRPPSTPPTKRPPPPAGKAMHALADQFEAAVGGIVTAVSSAATELEAAATTLTSTADTTQRTVRRGGVGLRRSVRQCPVGRFGRPADDGLGQRDQPPGAGFEPGIASDAVGQAQATDERIVSLSRAASPHRRRRQADLGGRRADQPPGAQRHHRGGARRRGRQGLRRRGAARSRCWPARPPRPPRKYRARSPTCRRRPSQAVTAIKAIASTIDEVSASPAGIASAVEEQGAVDRRDRPQRQGGRQGHRPGRRHHRRGQQRRRRDRRGRRSQVLVERRASSPASPTPQGARSTGSSHDGPRRLRGATDRRQGRRQHTPAGG